MKYVIIFLYYEQKFIRFFHLPRVFWVYRCQMTDRLMGHSKVSQWSKINLFGLQIGRYIQDAQSLHELFVSPDYKHWDYLPDKSFFTQLERLYLVEYFSGSKSTSTSQSEAMIENSQGPRAKPKQIAWLVCQRNEYQWICPNPPIIANLYL